jgi:hypothetical protein
MMRAMAAKPEPLRVAFDELRPLFGLAQDAPEVLRVLERASAKWKKPDGDCYAVARRAGFDLLARRPNGATRGAPRVVTAAMPPPERTWKRGKGAVPTSTPDVSHDRWRIDDLHVIADYDHQTNVRTILVSVPDQP